jgi:ketosteroid isomerase-like protein
MKSRWETEMSSQTGAIDASLQRYIEAVRTGDVDTIVSMYCEDAVLMPPNDTSLYGRAELKEWHEDYFRHFRVATLSETENEVVYFDKCAVQRWAYMVVIMPINGGERIRDDGRFLIVWKQEADGVWRMSQTMFNSIRPVGSGTSRFLARMMEGKKAG